MITDNVVKEALKETFFQWALTKGYADRICWLGNALEEPYKNAPWFKFTIIPMQPVNRFRAALFSGIVEVSVIGKANKDMPLINTTSDEILALYPIVGNMYKDQPYYIYRSYKEQEQTEGSYIIQPVLLYYEAFVEEE